MTECAVTLSEGNIEPLEDWILVKHSKEANISTGGIIIPDIAKRKTGYGKVLAIGPGIHAGCPHCECSHCNRDLITSSLKVGESVAFGKFNTTQVGDNDNLLLIRERDIKAIVLQNIHEVKEL